MVQFEVALGEYRRCNGTMAGIRPQHTQCAFRALIKRLKGRLRTVRGSVARRYAKKIGQHCPRHVSDLAFSCSAFGVVCGNVGLPPRNTGTRADRCDRQDGCGDDAATTLHETPAT